MKNTLIRCSFALILLAGMLSGSCRQQGGQKHLEGPVNILFIFTDDQRWDALGYAGNEVIRTPNLDRLAARGTYFDNAFVTTSICCVSRASVLTGQYGRYSGVEDFFTPIRLETTYPRYLREAGYYTGFIGKWGTQERDTGYFMKAADLFDFWAGSMGQSNYWHERNCNFVRNTGPPRSTISFVIVHPMQGDSAARRSGWARPTSRIPCTRKPM